MKTTRRQLLKSAAIGGIVSSFLPLIPLRAENKKITANRALRIAHIADVHLLEQRNAEASFARVVADINSLKDKPDLIINTGDTVMDENKQSKETVTTSWNVWRKLIQPNKIKMYSALGNHDVWNGPNEALDNEYRKDRRYGKQWAMEMLSMTDRFYTFEAKGWHFIALDSINGIGSYQLDDAQFEWLQGQLQSIPAGKPVCVFNHVPIISMAPMLSQTKNTPPSEVKFPMGGMHLDHQRIKDLFFKHKNVKLCLSGHIHYQDAVEFLGVKYMCNGAVSGNWWRDPIIRDEFPPMYSIIDLYDDGTSRLEAMYYKYEA